MESKKWTEKERHKLKAYLATIRYLYNELKNNPKNKDKILIQIDNLYTKYHGLLYQIKEKYRDESGYNHNFIYSLATLIARVVTRGK